MKPAASITTSTPTPNILLLEIQRTRSTTDAVFGELRIKGQLLCYTMEKLSTLIPAGRYTAVMAQSPHFGFPTPHLSVPNRTYIELHPANYPYQLEGCIAVGKQEEGDALDYSDVAFESLVKRLPPSDPFQILIS